MAKDDEINVKLTADDKASPKIKKMSNNMENLGKEFDKVENKAKKSGKAVEESFSKGINITALADAVNQSIGIITKLSKRSADYIETLNVLDVAFEGNTNSIRNWANTISETLNLDDSTLIKAASSFKVLSQSMGYTNDIGEKFSKTLSQMTLDVSSLYNMDFSKAQSALQYAIQGQGKTLKATTGASVLQTTVQTQLDLLGIDAEVESMNDAEKAMARLIAIINQLKSSQGDLARTIESPANQFRVWSEQTSLLARNLGNVLLPTLAKILPYLNGIIMAINTILSGIAKLVGYDEQAWDFGVSSSAFDGLEESIGGVADAAGNAKKQLMGLRGFDKLNVIRTPSATSGSGGGAGGGGGINPKLLEAFDKMFANYDTKLAGIKTKASQIRDNILEWLGFSRKLNPITGEIEWKYQGLGTTIKNMWKSFKGLSTTGKVLVALGLGTSFSVLFKIVSKLVTKLGAKTGLTGILKGLINPFKTMTSSILNNTVGVEKLTKATTKFKTALGGIKSIALGATVSILGIAATYDSFKSINEEGQNLKNTLGVLAGSFSAVAGAALVGFSIGGPVGAGIGALVGLIGAFTAGVIASNNALTPQQKAMKEITDRTREYNEELAKTQKLADQTLVSKLVETGYHQTLIDELDQIVDANGKVKQGYEDRAQFILNELSNAYGIEYSYVNGQIQDYNKLKQQIKDVIQQKEIEYYLDKTMEIAEQARQTRTKAIIDQKEALEKLNETKDYSKWLTKQEKDAQDELNKAYTLQGKVSLQEYTVAVNEATENLNKIKSAQQENNKTLDMAQTAYNKMSKTVEKADEQIKLYEDMKTAALTGNYDEINTAIDEYKNTYINDQGEIVKVSDSNIETLIQKNKKWLKETKKDNEKYYNDKIDTLTKETTKVKELTPEQEAMWAALAKTDRDGFVKEIKKLPDDIRTNLLDELKKAGIDMSDSLQKGVNQKKTTKTIDVDADTTKATNKMNSWVNNNKSSFESINLKPLSFKTFGFANGGLPSVGQLFYMNERGPEFMGQIGGQSFVANQNQMMDLLDKKISNAGGINNATFVVQVGNEEIGKTVLKDLNKMAKSNGKPIVIGG